MKLQLEGRNVYHGTENLETLRNVVVRHQHAKIKVDQKTVTVDAQTANVLVTCHDALSTPDAKLKFVAMLAQSPSTFERLVTFCWKQVSA